MSVMMDKGFFLLELLLSLSAWFLMCLFILPILTDLNHQSLNLEVNNKAQQLLFEELQAKQVDDQTYKNYSVFDNQIEYKIIWRDSIRTGQKEVCVKVENSISPTEKCAVPE